MHALHPEVHQHIFSLRNPGNAQRPALEFAERLVALGCLVLLLPLLAIIYFHLRLAVGAPAIYRQLRLGRYARPFFIYKFSTMREDATARLPKVKKNIHDARILKMAGWLRRWKLDELPQLVNVLRGEMSFIGPRPLPVTESLLCPFLHQSRYHVKPGLTGLWQATVPSGTSLWRKFELDSRYVRNKSLSTDLRLLFKTVLFLPYSEGND